MARLKKKIEKYLESKNNELPLILQKDCLHEYSSVNLPSRKVVPITKFKTSAFPAQTLYKPISQLLSNELFRKIQQ
jgi:hypothetical protein